MFFSSEIAHKMAFTNTFSIKLHYYYYLKLRENHRSVSFTIIFKCVRLQKCKTFIGYNNSKDGKFVGIFTLLLVGVLPPWLHKRDVKLKLKQV